MNESITRIVPIESIYVDDSINVSRGCKPIAELKVASLAEDIKTHGLLESLGVAHVTSCEWLSPEEREIIIDTGCEWMLIYGFRRQKACLLAGLLNVRVSDLGTLSRADAELANVAENGDREPPTDFDVTMACHRLVVFHKKAAAIIATRTGRSIKFVEDSVLIVTRVEQSLLQFYRANCSREVRRRMLELAAIDGVSDDDRFRKQKDQWQTWESADAQERRENPNAGFSPRGGGGGSRNKPHIKKRALIDATERTMVAREFWNGKQWVPANQESKDLALSWLRWALNPDEPMPVR